MSGFLFTQDEVGLFAVSTAFGIGFSALIPAYVLAIRELLSAERSALAGADAAAAQRQRHGDRRMARRLSLRHLRLLHRRPSPPALRSTSPTSRCCSCCWCGSALCLYPLTRNRRLANCHQRFTETVMRLSIALAAGLLALSPRGGRADLQVLRRRSQGRDRGRRPVASLGARVPARRPHAGHRAARPHAHRHAGRQAVAAAAGRAEGFGIRTRRPARRRARPQLRAEPDDLFLLRRAGRGRRTHRAGARPLARRQARRRQSDFPAGGPAVERPAFRLPHRAERRTTTCS